MTSPYATAPITFTYNQNAFRPLTAEYLTAVVSVTDPNIHHIVVSNQNTFDSQTYAPSVRFFVSRQTKFQVQLTRAGYNSYMWTSNGELVWAGNPSSTSMTPVISPNTYYTFSVRAIAGQTITAGSLLKVGMMVVDNVPLSTLTPGIVQIFVEGDQVVSDINTATSTFTFTFTNYPIVSLSNIFLFWANRPLITDTDMVMTVNGTNTNIFPNGQTNSNFSTGSFLQGILSPLATGSYTGTITFQCAQETATQIFPIFVGTEA